MLMSLENLLETYLTAPVRGILHVGAHLAEEAETYDRLQVPVWWVEANPFVMGKLACEVSKWPHQYLIQALVTDYDYEETPFHITNYDGMSSSVYEFGDHPKYSPDTVMVREVNLLSTTIDTLVEQQKINANLLNLDIQGAELLALKGAEDFLEGVDYIYTEVSTGPVYQGGALMHEVDQQLWENFRRVETDLGMHGGTHGDAFYVRAR